MLTQSIKNSIQSINVWSHSINKWAQSTKGIHGEQGGNNTIKKRRLAMWSNRKMKSIALIHNDDVKCLPVIIQETHILVVMGRINFKDHALNKR